LFNFLITGEERPGLNLTAIHLTPAIGISEESSDCEDKKADPVNDSPEDSGQIDQERSIRFLPLLDEDSPRELPASSAPWSRKLDQGRKETVGPLRTTGQ
jgi:hypothetical protein